MYLNLLAANVFGVTAVAFPVFYYWVLQETHFGSVLYIHTLAPLAFAIVFTYIVLVDWIFVSVFVAFALLYTNITQISIKLMK